MIADEIHELIVRALERGDSAAEIGRSLLGAAAAFMPAGREKTGIAAARQVSDVVMIRALHTASVALDSFAKVEAGSGERYSR